MNLEDLRCQIDAIDGEILKRINRRAALALQIGQIKKQNGKEIYVPSREKEVFRKLLKINTGPLDEKAVRAIYREIISASIALEKPLKIACLEPAGSLSHRAAREHFGASLEYQPVASFADLFAIVKQGEADYAVIPFETPAEGLCGTALLLLADAQLGIISQVSLEEPVSSASPSDQDQEEKLAHCVVLGANPLPFSEGGKYKSSFVLGLPDQPVELSRVQEAFQSHGLSVTRMEAFSSQPAEPHVFLEVAGHCDEMAFQWALAKLRGEEITVQWLGSYPAAAS